VWCSQTGDHPHEDLAKFGYGPGMKVKKKKQRILLYFGNPTVTCSRDMAISINELSRNNFTIFQG
jgi:hypothetical protein